MITFNNIVERFKIFAENHFFIETFSFGSPDDVDLTKFTSFPLMHLVYTGATYDPGTKTYNLEVYILDVPADKTKKVDRQKEVVSDAEQCAEDIIADIKNGGNIFLFAQDYEVVNATTTPLEEETKNVLSGVLLDLSVSIPYEWDACNAPIDGVEPGGTEVTYARRGVLRMLTLDGATDVPSVRTIKVTNGTLTDDGDGVVTLDTGGVDTLAGLTDVDVTGVTDGQVLKYDDATGEWIPANDQSATSLGNLDDVSITTPADREALIYDGGNWVNDNISKTDVGLGNVDNTSDADKPVSSATQTALNAKADTSAVPTELNDLSDVTIAGTPAGNEALIYDTATSSFKSLPNFTNRFEDEAENNKQGITPFAERVYTVKADGDGIFIDPESDTPTAGKVIVRKIYQKAGFLENGDVIGDFTLIHTFADDTAYSATTSTFEGFRDGDTYGTPPFTLIQTWEETTAAPAFTGLLNESYGSGAAAAYSVRRLNGNYTGAAIQVERSSDNTTQDIGFDSNGDLDESALTTFCTGTTCKVRTWYGQETSGGTGSGNDAVQTTHANQPTIYTGGAIVKKQGRVALYSDDSTTFQSMTGSISGIATTFTHFAAMEPADIKVGRVAVYRINSTIDLYDNGRIYEANGVADTAVSPAFVAGSYYVHSLDRKSGEVVFYGNGVQIGQETGAAPSNTYSSYRLLSSGNSTGNTYDGYVSELLFFGSSKTSDRTSIESNIGDYFTQNTPLLDTYTGAAAAYSLRKLRSAYSGSAIRVRRASDNTEQDIGFNVFGELDTVSLASFCSGTDGFVKTWYDQASTNDATQTNTANQPKIYDSVTGVVTDNGKPAVEFLDSADILASSSATEFNSVLQNELYCVASYGTINVGNQYAGGVQIGGSSRGIMIGTNSSGDDIRYHCDGATFEIAVGGTIAVDTQILHGGTYDGTTRHARLNGASVGTNTDAGTTGTANAYFIGKHPSLSAGADKKVQELVLYPAYNGNEANIESNINTFYSIY